MADFRRWLPAFAVLAVSLMALAPASAQVGLNCVGTGAVPPLLRAEGFTELTGDVVISCSSTIPLSSATSPLPTANLVVFLTAPVTSRLTSTSTTAPNSEVLLMINDPSSTVANPCTVGSGCPETPASVGSLGTGATNFHNIYQGQMLTNAAGQGYAVQFLGVPIVPPATVGGTPTTYRITNLRADVVGIGGVLGSPAQVQATLSISPVTPGATMTLANPTQVVGFVQPGLTFTVTKGGFGAAPVNIQQCNGLDFTNSETTNDINLNFKENFATAFRVRINGQLGTDGTLLTPGSTSGVVNEIPGSYFNNESGYFNPAVNAAFGSGAANIGLADTGTRLKATFANIPAGVNLWVPLSNSGASLTGSDAVLTSAEVGAFSAVSASSGSGVPSGYAQIPVSSTGAASAVWEVVASQGSVQETFTFPVIFTATGAAGATPPSPAVGNATVAGSLAPNPSSGAFTAAQAAMPSTTLAIPRFADTGTPIDILSVNTCRTILLYPFVTNQLGFDTGMAISNTSTDPYSSVGTQSGTCTLSFFGASAPSALTTASISGGTTYTTLASSVAPGFQGYVFAICNFQFAHGFAFVSDMGARNLAMGYLPLIVPDRGGKIRLPDPFSTAGAATGEILGQ